MSSALVHTARTASWLRLWKAVAAISLLLSGGALAQTANGGGAKVQAAYADWRRLSQAEVNCVDQSLRHQKTSLWALIQRGVDPANVAVARLRAACRAQASAPNVLVTAQNGSRAQATAVESALDRAIADKVAADKAASDKAAADKAAADKAAADKAAAEKAAAKAVVDKAAADRAAAAKVAAVEKVAAEQVAMDAAKAEAERAKAEANKADAVKAQAEAERPSPEADKGAADAAWTTAASEARWSFFYGLISSPICFGLGGLVFLLVQRRRSGAAAPATASAPDRAGRDTQKEFDRLVSAVLAEAKRREAKDPKPRIDESVLH